jgi:hypothetical protein
MDVDALALAAFEGVPGARLAGVIDMLTGLYLALEAGSCDPQEADLLAASVREMFAGEPAAGLRRSFAQAGDRQDVQEVIVLGEKAVFMFARVRSAEDAALAVACGRDVNLGIILTKTRELVRIG